jgi:NitT/TauT family transport system ATP-binding protein
MTEPKIRLENVGKTFGEGNESFVALEDLTLDIRPGEFLAIVGPSGSGKTTVLNMLAGLDAPTSGTIPAPSAA